MKNQSKYIEIEGKSGRTYHVKVEPSGSNWLQVRIYAIEGILFKRHRLQNFGHHARYRSYPWENEVTVMEVVLRAIEDVDAKYRRLREIDEFMREESE